MNIHEHQAKEILREFGAPVSNGIVIHSLEGIEKNLNKLSSKEFVLKGSKVDLVILLTEKILSRKNKFYKKTISFVSRKKIKMIEIAFLKSQVEKEQAYSDAIIHGLEEMTWKVIEKIIKKYQKV